jgi:hypothetical protein
MEELYQTFLESSMEGSMSLEQFVPLAHIMLQMIYSLSYPNEEWIELPSKKVGIFSYNLFTGEVKTQERQKTKNKKKKKKTVMEPPPPLRKRQGTMNLTDISNNEEEREHTDDDDTRKLVEEVAEKLQNNVRLIDTIIEEDEPTDEAVAKELDAVLDEVLQEPNT